MEQHTVRLPSGSALDNDGILTAHSALRGPSMLKMHVRATVAGSEAFVRSILADDPCCVKGQPVDVILRVGVVRVEGCCHARKTLAAHTMNGTERVLPHRAVLEDLEEVLADRLIGSTSLAPPGMIMRQKLLQLRLLLLRQPVKDVAVDVERLVLLLVRSQHPLAGSVFVAAVNRLHRRNWMKHVAVDLMPDMEDDRLERSQPREVARAL